jgi:hypothetical protein
MSCRSSGLADGGPNLDAASAAPLEMDGRPSPVHHAPWAVAGDQQGRHRTAADRGDIGHPVPLPRQQDPQPMDSSTRMTAGTVESPAGMSIPTAIVDLSSLKAYEDAYLEAVKAHLREVTAWSLPWGRG